VHPEYEVPLANMHSQLEGIPSLSADAYGKQSHHQATDDLHSVY